MPGKYWRTVLWKVRKNKKLFWCRFYDIFVRLVMTLANIPSLTSGTLLLNWCLCISHLSLGLLESTKILLTLSFLIPAFLDIFCFIIRFYASLYWNHNLTKLNWLIISTIFISLEIFKSVSRLFVLMKKIEYPFSDVPMDFMVTLAQAANLADVQVDRAAISSMLVPVVSMFDQIRSSVIAHLATQVDWGRLFSNYQLFLIISDAVPLFSSSGWSFSIFSALEVHIVL